VKKLVAHSDGLTAHPTLTVLAGDGLLAGRVPSDLHPVVADGHRHLDVLTAAPCRTTGDPNRSPPTSPGSRGTRDSRT
jgi:hypothetical protein